MKDLFPYDSNEYPQHMFSWRIKKNISTFGLKKSPIWRYAYEGESISNQPISFPMDRDGHDFHALFQYMFYTWVQNCTRIESFFNKILNVKHD